MKCGPSTDFVTLQHIYKFASADVYVIIILNIQDESHCDLHWEREVH